jgi:hypothetical protein
MSLKILANYRESLKGGSRKPCKPAIFKFKFMSKYDKTTISILIIGIAAILAVLASIACCWMALCNSFLNTMKFKREENAILAIGIILGILSIIWLIWAILFAHSRYKY